MKRAGYALLALAFNMLAPVWILVYAIVELYKALAAQGESMVDRMSGK